MVTNGIEYLASIHPLMPLVMATSMLGACAGVLGCFTLLRGQSLFGDAMAHASLPGIAITFLLTSSTNPVTLLCGGSCASLCGALLIQYIRTHTLLSIDTILGAILSSFFGLGLVLMTIVQHTCSGQQAMLGKFLFGNAALLLHEDIMLILIAGIIMLSIITICWKELVLFCFDPQYAQSIHFSPRFIDFLFTLLLVALIGIGMQTVGIMLITSLLIAPAAAARQLTDHITPMVVYAAFFGICSAVVGSCISFYIDTVPTGPAIIIIGTIVAFFTMLVNQRSQKGVS